MTENQAAQLLLERLKVTEAEMPKPAIVSFFPSILQTLASRIADKTIDRPAVRELLRKDFSVSVSSGVGDLSSDFTAAEPLLEGFARGWVVTSSSDLILGRAQAYSYKADRASINHGLPVGLGFYTVDGNSLVVVTATGNRSVSANYTIHGGFVPSLANLPVTLQDDFLSIGVELIREGGVPPTDG